MLKRTSSARPRPWLTERTDAWSEHAPLTKEAPHRTDLVVVFPEPTGAPDRAVPANASGMQISRGYVSRDAMPRASSNGKNNLHSP